MPETAPNPPPSSPAPGIPPVDPNALIATAVRVVKTPADFFRSIKDDKGFQKPLTFSVAVYLVYSVLVAVYPIAHGAVVPSIISIILTTLIGGIAGPFIGGIIIWAICLAFGSKATWDRAVPIAAYSSVVAIGAGIAALLLFVSYALSALVGLVVWLYGLYLCYVGAKALMFEPAPEVKPSA